MSDSVITKERLDQYLNELAKEFLKRNRRAVPAEIIIIGGASVVINYGFRESTYDMDAIIIAASSMKEAINYVGDKFGLPNGWLNDDFKKTESFSPKIEQFSKYYRSYANMVTFRTITGAYLVAMKMRSGRKYKYDRSDIVGILWYQEKNENPLCLEEIKKAVEDLYGDYGVISEEVRTFVEKAIENGRYEEMYNHIRLIEEENKENLLEYQKEKPDIITRDNVNDVIEALRKRKSSNQKNI